MRLTRLLSLALILIFTIYISDIYADPLFGTTGKISGTVTDSKDFSPLAGAIISIEGTNIKAGSDESGQYAILNVPVGTYSVKCTYVGYEATVQRDVRVSADLTSTVNFTMSVGGTVIDTLVIEVQKRTVPTETSGKIIGIDQIENTGIRGIDNIVALTSGVVQDEKGVNINIRGGRTGETTTMIDGVVTNNPLDRSSTAQVSNNALQEIAVLTGGFSAEYGNVLSGVINVTTKSGSANYSGSFETVSDVIAGDWIKTTQQGYNVYALSLGGPVIPNKKLSSFWSLFGSYERTVNNVSQPISNDAANLWSANGIMPNFGSDGNSFTGKSIMDFGAITNGKLQVKLTAGYNGNIGKDRAWIGSMGYYDSWHMPIEKKQNHQGFVKINQSLGSKTFYDLQASYLLSTYTEGDGILQFNPAISGRDGYTYPWYLAYGDTNVVTGLNGNGGQGNVTSSSAHFGVFRDQNRIYNLATKNKSEQYAFNLNFTHQVLTKKYGNHELKFGGNYTQYKVRYFYVNPAGYSNIPGLKDTVNHRINDPVINEAYANQNFLAGYGYDPFGNEIESDYMVDGLNVMEGPKKPRIGAFYLLDKMEFQYFNTNIGLRMDFMDPNTLVPIDYTNLKGADGVFDANDYQQAKKTFVVSPRLGFSFPITDKTVFHAQYGKFIQLPALQQLYQNQRLLRQTANGGVGYFTVFNNPLLKPERTTAYELGVKHQAGDYVTVGLTAYYKETSDLIQAKNIKAIDNTYSLAIYDNGDFGVIRGLDFSLDMRRINRLRASISYSLAYASGTGSDINTLSNVAYNGTEPPKMPSALSYDQRHTGTIELDYRFGGAEDVPKGTMGAILQRLGFNVLFTFNSGRPYTPSDNNADPLAVVSSNLGYHPTAAFNSLYSPWNLSLDLKIDKTVKLFNKLNVNIYLLALNVLNSEQVNAVFVTSGEAGNTGWLNSYTGQNWANTEGPDAVNLYNIRSHAVNNYGPPRQVRLGLRMFF
jgi:outer membrane receptor protein involved in Fe transport